MPRRSLMCKCQYYGTNTNDYSYMDYFELFSPQEPIHGFADSPAWS